MKAYYQDILLRISEEPKWYDQNGVPRFDEFHPKYCPNIYTRQVFLLNIACQACSKEFRVEMHSNWWEPIEYPRELHYGDPPIHSCVGDSMNCEDLEILEAWSHPHGLSDWKRITEQEGMIK